jgi:hypothetical protein
MKSQSPIDAVGPAFARARSVLLPPGMEPGKNAPFRFWFLVKMALAGALTQPGAYAFGIAIFVEAVILVFFFSGGVGFRFPGAETARDARFLAATVVLGGVALAVWVLLGWLWSRLRFTLFEMAVDRHGRVGLAWSHYAVQAWRYLALTILVSLATLLLLALTAGPLLFHLYGVFRHATPQQINADPSIVFSQIFPLYGIVFGFALLFALVDAIMQDFLIPPMAMDDESVEDAFGRFVDLLRNRPGYVALYFLLRFALQMGLSTAGGIAIFVVFGILFAGGFGIGFVLHHAFIHQGMVGPAIFYSYCAVAGSAGFALYVLSILVINGSMAVFRECYAVEFYGSFYAHLGSRLGRDPSPLAPQDRPPLPGL